MDAEIFFLHADFLSLAPAGNILAALLAAGFGLLVGSFLNVVVHRLPVMMQRESDNYVASESGLPLPHTNRYTLATPRSSCPDCGHRIGALENIPVFSYLAQRGKCRACKRPISARYPAVEIVTGALSAAVIWHFGATVIGLSALVLVYFLIAMTFIDTATQLLPDDLTLPLMWLGLLVNLNGTFVAVQYAVMGAAAGYMVLWTMAKIYNLCTGRDGIGYGDFKLLAALGAWMGLLAVPVILFLSTLIGSVVGITLMILTKTGRKTQIPFGPYLAVAGLLTLLFGGQILHWWLPHTF